MLASIPEISKMCTEIYVLYFDECMNKICSTNIELMKEYS